MHPRVAADAHDKTVYIVGARSRMTKEEKNAAEAREQMK